MQQLLDKSIDMILCDLPYGATALKWDSLIPFELLWQQFNRVIKDNGVAAITSAQPFTTKLIESNYKQFRYCWYWHKNCATGFPFSHHQPMRCMEDVCIFYKKTPTYNPQGLTKLNKPLSCKRLPTNKDSQYRKGSLLNEYTCHCKNYPQNLLEFNCERGFHPTQKPVALFEYLIRTYTNEGELVLDATAGSCTTAIACMNAKRDYICFELDEGYYSKAVERVARHAQTK